MTFATIARMIGIRGFIALGLAAALAFAWWRVGVWHDRADRLAHDLANVKAAQVVALERAEAARARTEAKYLRLAGRIDNEAHNARVGALADADEYIRTHRVRCEAVGGAGSGTVAADADRGSGGGQSASAAPELDVSIAVSADDVRICTRNTVQAEAARDWALSLEAATAP